MVHLAKTVWKHWAMFFSIGVVLYLAGTYFVNSKVPHEDVSSSAFDDKASHATTSKSSVANDSGSLKIRVTAFRIRGSNGEVTIEIRNTGKTNAEFDPGKMVLDGPGGRSIAVLEGSPTAIVVSPHFSQFTPVSFPLSAPKPGRYKLIYDKKEVFAGPPDLGM